MATGWTLDFCLVCDQQTSGNEAYCSQGCRLADLDQDYSASSPKHSNGSRHTSVYRHQQSPSVSADQAALAPSSRAAAGRRQALGKNTARPRYESSTPGSSQSSSVESSSSLLGSSSSSSSTSQIKHELHDYTGYFDQVRDWKRRQMSS